MIKYSAEGEFVKKVDAGENNGAEKRSKPEDTTERAQKDPTET